MNKKGNVLQWPIIKEFDKENNLTGTKLGSVREVEPLKGSQQIATGSKYNLIEGDHVLALNKNKEVFAMGDDTLGQCGQCDTDRHTHPPFIERRVKFPSQVVILF